MSRQEMEKRERMYRMRRQGRQLTEWGTVVLAGALRVVHPTMNRDRMWTLARQYSGGVGVKLQELQGQMDEPSFQAWLAAMRGRFVREIIQLAGRLLAGEMKT